MARLQAALTKSLTDEHERVDLSLREKVIFYNILYINRKKKLEKLRNKEKRQVLSCMVFSTS
jgi:hypothetical protein